MNIILANMPINNGNRGCVALSVSSMYILDELLTANGVKYNFYLPDSGFKENKQYSVMIGGKEIFYNTFTYPIATTRYNIKHWLKCILNFKDYIYGKKVVKSADFILDIGQGDSFADIYGARRFYLIDRVHKLARSYNKPYCLLPQTIGPFKDLNLASQAMKSINNASLVMPRDRQSLAYVNENSVNKVQQEYIDVAFAMPFTKKKFDDDFIHVGLNISGLLWNGGYTGNNQFGLKMDFKELVKDLISYFLEFAKVKVHLIGHVVLGEVNVENDYAVSYDLYKDLDDSRVVLAPFFFCPMEAKSYISGMDFFTGARMHATIAAFSSGVAVFPLAYSRKFNGLFGDTLKYKYLGDLINDSKENLMIKLNEAFESREELTSIIANRQNGIVQAKINLIKEHLNNFLFKV